MGAVPPRAPLRRRELLKLAGGLAGAVLTSDGRLIDENGNFQNGPETRFALCSCVQ
jgi:roadblock/LC7 domain-containing protein